jgi:hypothetical protein
MRKILLAVALTLGVAGAPRQKTETTACTT